VAEREVLHKKEEITRLESERAELLVQIEAGEGASTAIQQLSQEKVTPFREFLALSVCVNHAFLTDLRKLSLLASVWRQNVNHLTFAPNSCE
jgi:hypothetical protein